MQKGSHLEFECQECKAEVPFSLSGLEKNPELQCTQCSRRYLFDDETLKRQIKKFDALCNQIHDSQEILSMASIGVDMGTGTSKVKVPFKLLLTRLSSHLDLTIGGKPCLISFRFEPLTDAKVPHAK